MWSSLMTAVTTASTTTNIIITLVLLFATIGITLWYRRLQQSAALTASEFASRGIKFAATPNFLLLVLRKIRFELMQQKMIQREGKIFGTTLLGSPTIVLANPELIGVVLSKEFTSFTNRRAILIGIDSLFSNMLSVVEDETWKRLRSIITPTFSTGKLRQMKPCMNDTVRQLMHDFDDQFVKNDDSGGGGGGLVEVNIKPICGAYTMNTIIQVAFGVKVDALASPDNPIIQHAKKIFSKDMSLKDIVIATFVFLLPSVSKFFGWRALQNKTTDFFTDFAQKIITEKRAAMLEKRGQQQKDQQYKASNFIEFLLEAEIDNDDNDDNVGGEKEKLNGKNQIIDNIEISTIEHSNGIANGTTLSVPTTSNKYITNQEIIAQCVLFLLAGYDTTATTITMATYLLALNPDKQEKLHQEIVHVIQQLTDEAKKDEFNNGDSIDNDPVQLITIDTLTRFEYLNGVISETLRLYAPATTTERMAAKDIELQSADGQYRVAVKKGEIINIPIYVIHHDEENFPNPEQFEPERFISGTVSGGGGGNAHHKYAYLPFGGGPRNCVARSLALIEVKLAVLHMIRRYRFTTNARTDIPVKFYDQGGFITPKDIILSVEKRL